ncbi:MAG: cupredoxin domain-containing protein [Bacillota bacterium]
MRRWGAAVSALMVVGVLAGCSSGSTSSTPAQVVELSAENMAFSTKEITVKKGTPVKLVLTNKDTLLHDFTVEKMPAKVKESKGDDHGHDAGLSVHVAADTGKTGTVEFTPTEAGSYTFTCTVPGHKDAGMVGKLIVQ